jgi:hypothetical protein
MVFPLGLLSFLVTPFSYCILSIGEMDDFFFLSFQAYRSTDRFID